MSILLDALKKSEEQRQLGNAPDIHTPEDHRPGGAEPGVFSWPMVAMFAVAAIAILWIVWAQYREPAVVAVSDQPVVSQRAEQRPSAGTEPDEAVPQTPVESYAEPAAEQANDAITGSDTADQRRQELARNFSEFENPAQTEDGTVDSVLQESPPGPVPDAQTEAAQDDPVAASPPAHHESEPVSYWELPQNVRDSMPEFRITVMVYAEEPSERFLLINGQRLFEKESIDGVQLEEIRRNGAVFRYRNYRFLVRG